MYGFCTYQKSSLQQPDGFKASTIKAIDEQAIKRSFANDL